jgi:type VII secretion integral membrane protein EccD
MAAGLSRVTIVAGSSRVDLALPSDVPLADLLPVLLGFSGRGGDEAGRRNGWSLSRLGGGELDSSSTPAQLAVRDGELLYLRPRGDEALVTVFDDLVDAVATGSRARGGRWTPAITRGVGLTAGVLALLAGVVALPFAGPPYRLGGLIAVILAVALLVVAVVFARALGDGRSAIAFGLVATAYAATGGLLVLAGDRSLGQLTLAHAAIGGTLAVVAATIASIAIPGAAPIFLCVGTSAGAALVATGIAAGFGIGAPAAAAVTVLVASATLPALPMLAYRMVGLPIPAVPTEREHLRQDPGTVDGARVLGLARRADAFLAAMLGALAIINAAAAVLVASSGLPGIVLCGVLGLLPLVRARWFAGRAQRLPLLLSGGVALAAGAVAVFTQADQMTRLVGVFGATIVIAAVSIAFGLAQARSQSSPVWGRLLDVVEVLLILALAPLAVWTSGLLDWIRAIRG